MKTHLFISLLAAAVLLAAAIVRADLGHSWDSGSELPAAVDSALSSADSASEPASGDSSETSATPSPSLDAQIADLLDDKSLVSSSPSALDLSTLTVPLSEEEVLRDRLAVEVATEVAADAEAPSTPDISAPIGAADTTFATGSDHIAHRIASAFSTRGVSPASASEPAMSSDYNFKASDSSANYTDWGIGAEGGENFGAWRQADEQSPTFIALSGGFAISEAGGIGRSFANGVALESGMFSVDAKHDFTDNFSGFAIYGGENGDIEIFRWGVTTTEDREGGTGDPTGFWYAVGTGGQHDYRLIAEYSSEQILQTRLTYSLTWSTISGGLSLNLDITDAMNDRVGSKSLDVLTEYTTVTAIAAIVAGTTEKDTLHFDNLSVEGRAVPEPATILLLSLGTFLLATRRRR